MKPGKLRKKRSSLLLLCITVLLTATDTSSLARLRLGGHRVLTITVGNKVRMDVPEEHKITRRSTRGASSLPTTCRRDALLIHAKRRFDSSGVSSTKPADGRTMIRE